MRNFIILAACMLIFAACNKEGLIPPSNDEDMVEVSFNFAGDYVSIDEEPLTRALAPNAKTYYALQIYTADTVYMHGNPMASTHAYAHGLFDNISSIRISLPKKKKFLVEALIIKEREDTVFHDKGHYYDPFEGDNNKPITVTNHFVDSSPLGGRGIGISGKTVQYGIDSYGSMAMVDRYCGFQRFDLSGNHNININMERYACAFTYIVTPPIDGVIRVKIGNRISYRVDAGGVNQTKKQVIYSAPIEYCSPVDNKKPEQSCDINLFIEWERGDESLKSYTEERVINVKRKTNYNININMNSRDSESNFGFNYETDSFTDESININ